MSHPPLRAVDANSAGSSIAARKGAVLPAAFILIYLAQCVWFVGTQSLTYDEPVHIAEGLDAWRHGRFEEYNDHPPLARLLCTLPVISEKWQVHLQRLDEGFRVPSILPDPEALAWRTRMVNVVLGVALGLLLWSAARKLFSPSAANFVLALFAFSPSLIAHFSLVTTDGAATLLIFGAAWQLVRWWRGPSWSRTCMLGATLGLLLLAKYSTLPMFGLALVWILLLRPDGLSAAPWKWNWAKAASACVLALFVLWAGYFFHVSHLSVRDGTLTATFPNWHENIVKPVTSPNYTLLVPAGEFVQGFREVVRHDRHGQPAFFLEEVSPTGGWKGYYPITILLKWPLMVLLLCCLGGGAVLLRKLRLPPELWIMMSFALLYFSLAIFARFNLGERHVLPLYPFALLLAGALWQKVSPSRGARVLLIALAALNAADALRFAPDYLSYFTPLVRSEASYRFLSDSNLDWGQGLLAVRRYEREHPQELVWLAYFGSVEPAVYGIKATPLAENKHVVGTVIVSPTHLSGQFLTDPNGYRWLLRHPPVEVLDHSLLVFKIADTPAPVSAAGTP